MKFIDYFKPLNKGAKKALAERMDTSVAYLSQIAHGHRRAGAKILMCVEKATDGLVTADDLRPDLGEEAA